MIKTESVREKLARLGYHLTPASKWVKYTPALQAELREAQGFPVNDAFIKIWDRPYSLKKEFVVLYGTYGSSKTVDRIQEHVLLCITEKYFKCFYGRDKFDDAKKELHSSIVSAIKRMGMADLFEFSEKDNGSKNITCKENGNQFRAFGCDDEESIGKGWDDATHVLIDETNQLKEFKTFAMLQSRPRKIDALKCVTLCFNNCDVKPDHWLAAKLLNKDITLTDDTGKEIVRRITEHHSLFTDNYFIDHDDYRAALVEQAGDDPIRLEEILQGKWGSAANKQPFYKDFRRRMHVTPCPYNPDLAIWISWDENVNPGLPVSVWQFQGNTARCIWEIMGKNPHNTLEWVCAQVVRKFGPDGLKHESGALITGDATSVKDDVKEQKGKNFFTKAKEYLRVFRPRIRVGRSNPNVAMRRDFINAIWRANIYGLVIEIDTSCKLMIADLENTSEAPDGTGKDKTKTRVDGIAGVQPFGHFSDSADYVLVEGFSKQYQMFKAGNTSGKPRLEIYSEKRQPINYF